MMSELKKLLFVGLALTVGLGVTGCDEEDEGCNEAGVCPDGGMGGEGGGEGGTGGGEGGEGGEGGGGDTFQYVIVTDSSDVENMNGTPGVDICSVQSTAGTPVGATLNPGEGEICETDGPDCAANRADADAAMSFEPSCEPDSSPSHYVSLGVGGELTLMFDEDQAGATLTIVEFEGSDVETYSVQVCADAEASACLVGPSGDTLLVSDVTGTQSVMVPTPDAGDEGEEGGE